MEDAEYYTSSTSTWDLYYAQLSFSAIVVNAFNEVDGLANCISLSLSLHEVAEHLLFCPSFFHQYQCVQRLNYSGPYLVRVWISFEVSTSPTGPNLSTWWEAGNTRPVQKDGRSSNRTSFRVEYNLRHTVYMDYSMRCLSPQSRLGAWTS